MSTSTEIKLGSETSAVLEYVRIQNSFASKKSSKPVCVGRIKYRGSVQIAEVAAMIADSGYGIKKESVTLILSAINGIIPRLLKSGYIVNWGNLCSMRVTMRGIMEDNEFYNPKNNQLVVVSTIGPVLRNIAADCAVTCVDGMSNKFPELETVVNSVDSNVDILYAQNTPGTLTGKNLGYNSESPDEGLFLECPDYTGGDLKLQVTYANEKMINFRVEGEIDTTYSATVKLATRAANANLTEPIVVTHDVTLKPAP